MKFSVIILSTAALLSLNVPTHAATLISDNFNSENGGSGISNYTGFTNWTGNGVDLNGNGFNDVLPGNGLYANITGANTSFLQSKSAFTFNAGDTVTLSFNYAKTGTTSSTINVSLGNIFSGNLSVGLDTSFRAISETINITPGLAEISQSTPQYLTFRWLDLSNANALTVSPRSANIAPQSSNFQFAALNTSNNYIDNVVITSTQATPTSVPEPFTVIGTLVGGTAALRMRKKIKSAKRV